MTTPEFERAQQDPDYVAWLHGMDAALEQLFNEDAPAVGDLDDPYSPEGLALCERAIRERFGDASAVQDPANAEIADRFGRYIGEVHRRATEGWWVNMAPMLEVSGIRPQVQFPFSDYGFDPHEQIGDAFITSPQSPTQLVWVLSNMVADYEFWRDSGRPTPEEFDRLVVQRMISEAGRNEM